MKSNKNAKLVDQKNMEVRVPLTPMQPSASGFSFVLKQKEEFRDGLVMQMLKNAAPMPLGTPGWLIREAWTRTDHPYSTEQILGARSGDELDDSLEDNLNAEYGFRMGYQFSWGSLEEVMMPADEDCPLDMHLFLIFPEKALCVFPRSDLLSELMEVLYEAHPLADEDFATDDWGSWNTLGFGAWNKDQKKLRTWMHDIFLPKILPDLLDACFAVATAFRQHGIDTARRLLRSYGCTLDRSGMDDSIEELEKTRQIYIDPLK